MLPLTGAAVSTAVVATQVAAEVTAAATAAATGSAFPRCDSLRRAFFGASAAALFAFHEIVTPEGPHRSRLTDDIEYELPLGVLGRAFGGSLARRQLERLFAFRHEATRAAVEGVA